MCQVEYDYETLVDRIYSLALAYSHSRGRMLSGLDYGEIQPVAEYALWVPTDTLVRICRYAADRAGRSGYGAYIAQALYAAWTEHGKDWTPSPTDEGQQAHTFIQEVAHAVTAIRF